LKDTFETCTHTTTEATNSPDNISIVTQEPTLDMEGNDTNTATQEPMLALKKKNHIVTKEPTVNSKVAPQEPIADMREMIKHKKVKFH
jgi:hypothetical protein